MVRGLGGLTVIDSLAQKEREHVFPGVSQALSVPYHHCPIPSLMGAHDGCESMLPEKDPRVLKETQPFTELLWFLLLGSSARGWRQWEEQK